MDDMKNKPLHRAGFVMLAQTSNPIKLGETGFWFDGTTMYWVNAAGTATAVSGGNTYHEACRLATAAALGAGSYSNGVFTQTTAATEQIDSTTVVVGDRILVKNQVTDSQNGIYVVTVKGTGSVKQKLTRAPDCNASDMFEPGFIVPIAEGSVNADSVFEFTANAPFTMDSTSATFSLMPISITYGSTSDMAANGLAPAGTSGVSSKVMRADAALKWGTDLVALKEVDHVVNTDDTTTAATAGGAMSVKGGKSKTTGTGGAAKLIGGAGDTAAIGGVASVTGGAGGATSGAGGAASLVGGVGTNGNAAGGASSLAGGAGQGSANGGAASVAGGLAGATGTGGAASMAGGAGGATSGTGGAASLAGGAGTLNADGGACSVDGGAKNGSGTDGVLSLGATNASAVTLGRAGKLITRQGRKAAGAATDLIADPGNAGAIPVTQDGVCAITTAGAETRTLAIPTYIGQEITLCCDVRVGNAVTTVATAFDSAAHTTITMTAAGQSINLKAVQVAGVRCWRLKGNDGTTLG